MFKILEENCNSIEVGELYAALNRTNKIDNMKNLIDHTNKTVQASYFYGSKMIRFDLINEFLKHGWTIIYDTIEFEPNYSVQFNLGLKNV